MVLKTDNLALRFDSAGPPVFSNVTFGLAQGETCFVRGGAASGKTLLGLALCGLLPLRAGGWRLDGSIELFGSPLEQGDSGEQVGVILENPYTQLSGLKKTVRHELAFPLECIGMSQGGMLQAIEEIGSTMGITHLLDRNVRTLSGGELQRVLVSSSLIARPRFLFLDRPLTEIDTEFRLSLMNLVRLSVVANGGAAVVTEDPWLLPSNGFDQTVDLGGYDDNQSPVPVSQAGKPVAPDAILSVDALSFAYREEEKVLSDVSFEVRSGEVLFVGGTNGSGKTTLAKLVTGIIRPLSGRIFINGRSVESLDEAERFSVIGYALQNPAYHLCRRTVADELDTAALSGQPVGELVSVLGLNSLMNRHPLDLTQAEKKRSVVILDEPSQYQDADGFRRIVKAVLFCIERGSGMMIITHDPRFPKVFPNASGLCLGVAI